MAPLRTASAIWIMFSSPSDRRRTDWLKMKANTRARNGGDRGNEPDPSVIHDGLDIGKHHSAHVCNSSVDTALFTSTR